MKTEKLTRTTLAFTIVLMLGLAVSCGKKEAESDSHANMHNKKTTAISRVASLDGIQVAVDLMPMAEHMKMMQMMKMTMKHDSTKNYTVMLTLIQKSTNMLVKDAAVSGELKNGDQSLKLNFVGAGGKGMFHYVSETDVKAVPSSLDLVIKTGTKTLKHNLNFTPLL